MIFSSILSISKTNLQRCPCLLVVVLSHILLESTLYQFLRDAATTLCLSWSHMKKTVPIIVETENHRNHFLKRRDEGTSLTLAPSTTGFLSGFSCFHWKAREHPIVIQSHTPITNETKKPPTNGSSPQTDPSPQQNHHAKCYRSVTQRKHFLRWSDQCFHLPLVSLTYSFSLMKRWFYFLAQIRHFMFATSKLCRMTEWGYTGLFCATEYYEKIMAKAQ